MTIAYIANGEIWLMDADGGNQQQVTDDAVHKVGLAWSEDGSRIYYDALPTGHPKDGTESFVIGLEDGSGALPVDSEEGAIARMWPRSPDGTKSMVVLRDGDQTDIYVVDNSGDERTTTRLTDNPNVDINPTWSPDSMKIAFASGPSMGGWRIAPTSPSVRILSYRSASALSYRFGHHHLAVDDGDAFLQIVDVFTCSSAPIPPYRSTSAKSALTRATNARIENRLGVSSPAAPAD